MSSFRSHFGAAVLGGLTVVFAGFVADGFRVEVVSDAQAHPGHDLNKVKRPGCMEDSQCPIAQQCEIWNEPQEGVHWTDYPTYGHCFTDLAHDKDFDGVPDAADTCPSTVSANQHDTDRDGYGDVCDKDDDGDGVLDVDDNCNKHKNKLQKDTDGDGRGDVCDDRDMLKWFWAERPDLAGSG